MSVEFAEKASYDSGDLVTIMRLLRGAGGCPWDAKQDHHTIRKNLLEESYEVLEAIDADDPVLLQEELGDLLLQVAFHACIEEEAQRFNFDGVCDGICKKLILRHPHVFGRTSVSGDDEVLANWEQIKQRSKGQTTAAETLHSVPAILPALMRSEKVQSRAAKAGFDYPDGDRALRDLESELSELREAIAGGEPAQVEEELGDLLFAAVNVARFAKLDPEQTLTKACEKFIRRFETVEQLARERGVAMQSAPIAALDELWRDAKKNLEVLSQARLSEDIKTKTI